MSSLGSILASSAIGQGLGKATMAFAQGRKDKMAFDQSIIANQVNNEKYRAATSEMERLRQQQQIEDTVTEGDTDEARLKSLADIAAQSGRGDLQRKYLGLADESKKKGHERDFASAAHAITLGQYGAATDLLNNMGVFGQIHSIEPLAGSDPTNPTYSVYAAGPPDADGKPSRGADRQRHRDHQTGDPPPNRYHPEKTMGIMEGSKFANGSPGGSTLPNDHIPTKIGPICLDVHAAAALVSLKPSTLNDLRIHGQGPKFKRLGRRVVYTPKDLQEWVDAHPSYRSTSEADSDSATTHHGEPSPSHTDPRSPR